MGYFRVARHPPVIGNRHQYSLQWQLATALRAISLGCYGELGEANRGSWRTQVTHRYTASDSER
jgi:hypothetical protein